VLDSSPTGLFLSDLEGRSIYVNQSYQEMTGYREEQLLDWEWTRYAVYAEDLPGLIKGWQEALLTGEDYRGVYRCITAKGDLIWLDVHTSAITDDEERVQGYIGTLRDVTLNKKQEEADRWAASHDGLTHLRNRRGFDQAIDQAFASWQQEGLPSALLLIDLDYFKPVNDTLGHDVGDIWLVKIAEILQQVAADQGVAARQGGDEFALLLSGVTLEEARQLGEEVCSAIRDLVIPESQDFQVTASIGVAYLNDQDTQVTSWIKRADEACYEAKAAGRDQVVVHPSGLS